MASSDKKIAITLKPKLPSPSSPLISQNKFIPLSPYSSPYSPRPRPTYSALANLPRMSQSSTPYTRSPSTASSSSNVTRSPSDKPEFEINPNKQIIKIIEPLEEKKLNHGFVSLIEYLYPINAHFYNNDWQTREYYETVLRESQSIMVYHTYSKEFSKKIEYSKVKILKVLFLEEWGNKPYTNKVLAGYPAYVAYNYYEYQEAWYNTFLLRNHNHSWFLCYAEEFPNKYPKWFTKWFKYMGSIPEIFSSRILEGYNKYKLMFSQENGDLVILDEDDVVDGDLRVVDAGLFNGIRLSSTVNLSHLFYVGDAVFLGQWSETNIDTLVHVLECFHLASGLRINMCKSKIMVVHVDGGRVNNAASKLGFLILQTRFLYLGTRVCDNMSGVIAWKGVVEKVISRLSRWKMKTLPIGGRFTLLKSILGSMPIFHMSIFKVPASVLQSLESIRSHFFNGHDPSSNKSSWVKWSKDRQTGSRTCWNAIVKEVKVMQNRGINVLEFIQLKVGNGDTTSFWDDRWCNEAVLKELFPRIYALETCKYSTLLNSVTLSPMEDRHIWSLENSGKFSVASIRKVIDEKQNLGDGSATRWVKSVPIKVNIMA
nr:RNA-directed DNA polymerase, eukaryota, reverse transcriptase zinc-binding domain protein [Tanacetum cinerariifolium]